MQSERERLVRTVREFHRTRPLLPGIARQDLRGDLPAPLLDALLGDTKELVSEGEIVRAASHKVVLKEDETQARATIEQAFEAAGLTVPTVMEVLAKSGVEAARARSLLQILLREKRLVRINEELVFHSAAVDKLRALLAQRRGERFAVPTFKEWTGISRKYAIPLLEFLDRERVTRREGDERVVL
jgi:selenocysteine-specific elongation factor